MVLESLEKDWLALRLVAGVGTQTLLNLSVTFGSLFQIWQKSTDQPQQLGLRKDVVEKRLIESSPNIRLLCLERVGFPNNLLQFHRVPAVLYVKGELPDSHNLCSRIVGSWSCTSCGLDQTKRLINALA